MKNENTEKSQTLSPGDLCVIIAHEPIDAVHRQYIGRTVVLIELASWLFSGNSPYWRCAGLPQDLMVSYQVLRKIPPERMLDARMHDEPVKDIHEEEVKV